MEHGGKREGAGRKSKAEELGLKALLDKCFPEEERERVFVQLVKDAKSRIHKIRVEARHTLLAYTFGKPRETPDDQPDGRVILVERVSRKRGEEAPQ